MEKGETDGEEKRTEMRKIDKKGEGRLERRRRKMERSWTEGERDRRRKKVDGDVTDGKER